ncbi:MAG: amidohydrolase family protein, partial [Deltaproteobacteria bacterium]|nr:amidohydrolase family protein [Deltaproteobacteria bacterium]
QLTPFEGCDFQSDAGDDEVRGAGLKWVTDGTPIERRAFLNEDYADAPGVRGTFDLPPQSMPFILAQALLGPAERRQLLFHGVGDGAVDTLLNALDHSGGRLVWGERRTRIEHADLLFQPNFPRMARNGAMVVQNGRHLALTALFAQRLGGQTLGQMEWLRSLAGAGIPLALGTDSIGQISSPWLDIFLTAIHPTHPSEALTVEEALTAYTHGSAYAEFEEAKKGTLAPGMFADLAILSQDPFTTPLPQLPATFSVRTVVGGKVVWDAGLLH